MRKPQKLTDYQTLSLGITAIVLLNNNLAAGERAEWPNFDISPLSSEGEMVIFFVAKTWFFVCPFWEWVGARQGIEDFTTFAPSRSTVLLTNALISYERLHQWTDCLGENFNNYVKFSNCITLFIVLGHPGGNCPPRLIRNPLIKCITSYGIS